MPVSQISATSARSSSGLASRNGGRLAPPDSSSPSSRTVTGSGSRPVTAFQARQASTKVISWPLSSEAPRATDHLRAVGPGLEARLERVAVPELERVDRLHVVVAVEQHRGARRARGRGRPRSGARPCRAPPPRSRSRRDRPRAIRRRPGSRRRRRGRSRSTASAASRTAARARRRDRHRRAPARLRDRTWSPPLGRSGGTLSRNADPATLSKEPVPCRARVGSRQTIEFVIRLQRIDVVYTNGWPAEVRRRNHDLAGSPAPGSQGTSRVADEPLLRLPSRADEAGRSP